ncbi:hypothetical protein CSB37_03795 [bacterium DOLZORAL124_38_8]|nr:MAG: hypothetical protein CSB37_03795 [bacterium DOLZORAL124_38_8]
MKKLIMATLLLFSASQTFALSCAKPPVTPPLKETQNQYQTIGTLKIINFEKEAALNLMNGPFPDLTAEGKPRKYTTHKVKWDTLKKGETNSSEFILRIDATSWMGIPTKFKKDEIVPITTKSSVKNGVLTLKQDIGCSSDDWTRYKTEEIENLQMTPKTEANNSPEKQDNRTKKTEPQKSLWTKIIDWFNALFE